MKQRPLSVTVIGLAYVLSGAVGLAYHWREFEPWAMAVRAVAVVCGVLLLRGVSWARCLAVAWMVYHVVVGIRHSWEQGAMHGLFVVVILWCLYRPAARRYYR